MTDSQRPSQEKGQPPANVCPRKPRITVPHSIDQGIVRVRELLCGQVIEVARIRTKGIDPNQEQTGEGRGKRDDERH